MSSDDADDPTLQKRPRRPRREPRAQRWVHGAAAEGMDDDAFDRSIEDGWAHADEDAEREPGTLGCDGRRAR